MARSARLRHCRTPMSRHSHPQCRCSAQSTCLTNFVLSYRGRCTTPQDQYRSWHQWSRRAISSPELLAALQMTLTMSAPASAAVRASVSLPSGKLQRIAVIAINPCPKLAHHPRDTYCRQKHFPANPASRQRSRHRCHNAHWRPY